MAIELSVISPIGISATEKRRITKTLRFLYVQSIWGPEALNFWTYLSQGQPKNELPNCLKYFLFGNIFPKDPTPSSAVGSNKFYRVPKGSFAV